MVNDVTTPKLKLQQHDTKIKHTTIQNPQTFLPPCRDDKIIILVTLVGLFRRLLAYDPYTDTDADGDGEKVRRIFLSKKMSVRT